MERAFLHGDEISLYKIEDNLVNKSFDRSQILDYLDAKYRVFSQKGSFKCICCHEPVELVLPKNKQLHFRHKDNQDCAYSQNTQQYEKAIRTYENENRKKVAKVVFEEILRGNLAPFGIKLEPGTMYKKALEYVPDFILTFPYTEQKWVIDYFTGFENGSQRRVYYNHLATRLKSYEKEGFRSVPFIDKKWIAIDHDTNKGTLLSAETLLLRKGSMDSLWDVLLLNQLTEAELSFLLKHVFHLDFNINPNVHSLNYVNLDDRKCTIYRETELFSDKNTSTVYILDERIIPLERALTLNSEQDYFMLYQDREKEDIESFRKSVTSSYLSHLELLKKEEEERKVREIERKKQEEDEKRRKEKEDEARKLQYEKSTVNKEKQYYHNTANRYSTFFEVTPKQNDLPIAIWREFAKAQGISDEEFQAHLSLELLRRDITEKHKEKYNAFQAKPSNDEQLKNERLIKKREEILSKRIDGESWIKGNPRVWKHFVFEQILHNSNLSIEILLNEMKKKGFEFLQNYRIIRNVVNSFLDFVGKILK
jgi:hypothetical protein